MSGELGKASLDLEANLGPFERNVLAAENRGDSLRGTLDKIVVVANMAESALNDIKLGAGKAAESRVSAQEILSGVKHISEDSRAAAIEIDRVKLGTEQAAESIAAGDLIDHKLDEIRDNAARTARELDEVRLRLAAQGRPGVGVGPLGSGLGRVGLVGSAITLGALTAPAAAPAAIGLLASIPALAATAVGALGVLALAFSGVGKAIGGDKRAFDGLTSSQKQFVLTVRSLDALSDRLKQIAAQSVFPGLTKGLKAALSPGTVNAIETAIVQLGRAVGNAGAQWGKYFGSARFQHIFGPLMQSAARNIGKLSDTFLHLFDALGVIARAAIPFTNWLTDVIDKGAKFADAWLRARDASGQLAGFFHKAEDSLRLVGHLAGALIKVIIELGKAVYPVAKVAVKLLTDGLNALAGGISKAAPDIRSAIGGVLALIGQLAKTLGPVLGTLADIILKIIGTLARALVPVVAALTPIFSALRDVFRQVAPPLEKLIKDVVHALMPGIKALAKPTADLIHALGPVLAGALKVLDPILRFTAYLISTVATAFGFVIEGAARAISFVTRHWRSVGTFFKNLGLWIIHAFEYVWYLLKKGALEAALAVVEPFSHLPSFLGGWARDAKDAMQFQLDQLHAPNMDWSSYAAAAGSATGEAWKGGFLAGLANNILSGLKAVASAAAKQLSDKRHHHGDPKPGTHAWYMKYLGYDPTQQPTYSSPPPFTKNTGAGAGAGQKKHLTAGQRMQQHLNLVLDQTKLAVEKAQQGTAAWDRAVKAEEKALKAEIRYWDKRAHNSKLSADARDKALREELKYQKQLKALLAPIKAAATANESQFLAAFKAIQNQFAPNSFPLVVGGSNGGKTDTHLYDIKNEARKTNEHLGAIREQGRSSGGRMGLTLAATA